MITALFASQRWHSYQGINFWSRPASARHTGSNGATFIGKARNKGEVPKERIQGRGSKFERGSKGEGPNSKEGPKETVRIREKCRHLCAGVPQTHTAVSVPRDQDVPPARRECLVHRGRPTSQDVAPLPCRRLLATGPHRLLYAIISKTCLSAYSLLASRPVIMLPNYSWLIWSNLLDSMTYLQLNS